MKPNFTIAILLLVLLILLAGVVISMDSDLLGGSLYRVVEQSQVK